MLICIIMLDNQDAIDKELYNACEKEDLSEAIRLLNLGANPCRQLEEDGDAAIHFAATARNDTTDILEAIVSSGSITDIEVRCGGVEMTSLHFACQCGNIKCAMILVENGADVTAVDKWNCGVLYNSVCSNKVDMVIECLRWNGINVNELSIHNKTPLIRACIGGNPHIVRALLDAGADVNVVDNDGHTACWYVKDFHTICSMLPVFKN